MNSQVDCENSWRETQRQNLIEKGLPPEQARAIAEKSNYNQISGQSRTSNSCDKRAQASVKSTAKLSEDKLITASANIHTDPAAGNEMAFMHSILCQVGLPRSRVTGDRFTRKNGEAWMIVHAGYLDEGSGPVLQEVPYGIMPRLALAWMSTYAKRNNTREIPIGKSARDFLHLLGKPTSGGKRGTYRALRTQMHALAACRLQLGFRGRTFNGLPIEQFDAWGVGEVSEVAWPQKMLLSESYYSELQENGVPLDHRAYWALSRSALAMDIYCWLAHRLHRIAGSSTRVPWKALREQFGQEYQGKNAEKDFIRGFLPQLRNALQVYPEAKVKQGVGGLILSSSAPPIPYKG